MARRRRKGRGRKGSKAIPLVQTTMFVIPAWNAYKQTGFSIDLPEALVGHLTGYSVQQRKLVNNNGIYLGLGLLVASTIGAKIANKTGVNRLAKKLSAGMIKVM